MMGFASSFTDLKKSLASSLPSELARLVTISFPYYNNEGLIALCAVLERESPISGNINIALMRHSG